MKLSPDVAQLVRQRGFDVHVNVFIFKRENKLAAFALSLKFPQTGLDRLKFRSCQNADVRQHPRVRNRPGNVLFVHAFIERNAFAELFHQRVGLSSKDSPPRFLSIIL